MREEGASFRKKTPRKRRSNKRDKMSHSSEMMLTILLKLQDYTLDEVEMLCNRYKEKKKEDNYRGC